MTSNICRISIEVGCCLVLCLPAIGWAERALQHNPFLPPVDFRSAPSRGSAALRQPREWILRAVLIAQGDASLANIDGEILRVGQEFDGYTLVSIQPRKVIVTNGETETVIPLDLPGSEQ